MIGPCCERCGQPFLQLDGQVNPWVKIKLQVDFIRELLDQRRRGETYDPNERTPSALEYDEPITAPPQGKQP